MQDIFIIGAKGIGNYGGYETFLKKLIETDKNNSNIKYHVACKFNGQGAMDERKLPNARKIDSNHFIYYNAECFKVPVLEKLGSAQAIYYDVMALRECIHQVKANGIQHPIIYILTCRIGPFMAKYVKEIHRLGGKVFVNPDGHEWMRAKWSKMVRNYWRISEAQTVKHADLIICDSMNIEKYINLKYKKYNPKTVFIAYGSDIDDSVLSKTNFKVRSWFKEHKIHENNYYLIVGRFVPENNFSTMIKEFIKSSVKRDLVIVTNVEHNNFYESLKKETHFDRDPRIRFVGTVYDSELLKYIRENANGYLHGHSVGGTNPSLLEAMSYTKLNLLYDVGFNREVGMDAAFYWDKVPGSLSNLLNRTQNMSGQEIDSLGKKSRDRIKRSYNWQLIANKYNKIFGDSEIENS